jgi:hypothetical protein
MSELIICPYESVPVEQIPNYKKTGVCPICSGKGQHIPIDIDTYTENQIVKIRELLLSLTKDY